MQDPGISNGESEENGKQGMVKRSYWGRDKENVKRDQQETGRWQTGETKRAFEKDEALTL